MWLMTTRGFVSAVEWQARDEKQGMIVLRARERKHLESVLSLLEGARPQVVASSGTDYRYRAWVTRVQLDLIVLALTSEITYPNFKDAVKDAEHGVGAKPKRESRYLHALHSVWTVMGRIQPGGPYSAGGSQFPPIPKGEPTVRRAQFSAQAANAPEVVAEQATCNECGVVAGEETMVPVPDGFVCREVQPCLDRIDSRTTA